MSATPSLARPDALLLVIGVALLPALAMLAAAVAPVLTAATPLRYAAYLGSGVAATAMADGLFRNPPTN